MVEAPAGVAQTGLDVFGLEIRELLENLITPQAGGKQIEDVGDANPHASHARPTATLLRVDRNPRSKVHTSDLTTHQCGPQRKPQRTGLDSSEETPVLERLRRLELPTSTLARLRSTTELQPHRGPKRVPTGGPSASPSRALRIPTGRARPPYPSPRSTRNCTLARISVRPWRGAISTTRGMSWGR